MADWSETRVLLVGTGRYAATTVAALSELGAMTIAVFSPTGRADAFAARYGLGVAGDVAEAIRASDIVITCTSDFVIGPQSFTSPGRRLVIDLGLPRNVDPAVAEVAGVELLDLETVRLHAPLEEFAGVDDARSLVRDAATRFGVDRAVEPGIVALRKHIFEVLEAELDRARARGDSSPQTEAALRHLAGVLLHTPSVRARSLARDGNASVFLAGLEAVYGIRPGDSAADAAERSESA